MRNLPTVEYAAGGSKIGGGMMVELIGSGTTGAVVVVGLIVYEHIKQRMARRNGTQGFTAVDRDALMVQRQATIETAQALKAISEVTGNMEKMLIRMDERDKMDARQTGKGT